MMRLCNGWCTPLSLQSLLRLQCFPPTIGHERHLEDIDFHNHGSSVHHMIEGIIQGVRDVHVHAVDGRRSGMERTTHCPPLYMECPHTSNSGKNVSLCVPSCERWEICFFVNNIQFHCERRKPIVMNYCLDFTPISLLLVTYILLFISRTKLIWIRFFNSAYNHVFWDPRFPSNVRLYDLLQQLTLREAVDQLKATNKGVSRLNIPPYNYDSECNHGFQVRRGYC